MDHNEAVDTLNSLLRGELAAMETYQQAIAKVGDADTRSDDLRKIHLEHREAANTLRQHVNEMGGEPAETSGAWGSFVTILEGTAGLLGNTSALKVLKEGEESGISSYEKALQKGLPDVCHSLIGATLLPKTRAHLPLLDRLMDSRS